MPPPPENFEINGAIWCVLGPPESLLDQRKSIYLIIFFLISNHIFLLKIYFVKIMWIQLRTRV